MGVPTVVIVVNVTSLWMRPLLLLQVAASESHVNSVTFCWCSHCNGSFCWTEENRVKDWMLC